MGDKRNTQKCLASKSEGRRSFGISRHRCEENINVDPKEIRLLSVD
jgi:hypothetical protein